MSTEDQKDAERYRKLKRYLFQYERLTVGEAWIILRVVGACPSGEDIDRVLDSKED